MIEEIALENFKAFGEKQTISLAPLTLIYGQNSAGKSSIIQSLALMKQSIEAGHDGGALKPYMNEGVDLGSYKELVHNQNVANKFSFSFKTEKSVFRRPFSMNFDRSPVSISLKTRLNFDCLKEKIPFLDKVSVVALQDDLEVLSFEIKLVKSKSHAKNLREGIPLTYELIGLEFEKQYLSKLFDWLIENFEWVQIQRKKWVQQEVSNSEAEFEKDLSKINNALLEQTKFFDKKPSFIAFEKYVKSILKSKTYQLFGINFDQHMSFGFRSFNASNNLFILSLPFGLDVTSIATKDFPRLARSRAQMFNRSSPLNISSFLEESLNRLNRYLRSSLFLGPIRSLPHRFYSSSGVTPKTVGYSGERTPDLIQNDSKILRETNKWLKKLEMGYEIKAQDISKKASLFELSLKDLRNKQDNKLRVTLKDVGFGVSQVLPIIVQCIHSQHETILIEQPELHIHPKLQADLADLFIFSMTQRSNRLIIETHSEHLVLRISKQLKRRDEILSRLEFKEEDPPDKKLSTPVSRNMERKKREKLRELRRMEIEKEFPNEFVPDPILFRSSKLLVNFVSRGESSGSQVNKIRFTEDGKFRDKWPGGFFPERRREIIF